MTTTTRRQFLGRGLTTLAAGGLAAAPAGLVAGRSAVEAADQVRVALIGCGGMGRGDLRTFFQDERVRCPVVCDVDDSHAALAADETEKVGRGRPESVRDFRRAIERKDVDVCLVATPDHWHAIPTIHACQAGKDVYVEKPLATSIGEGAAMVRAARKSQRVVQVGTQWRSGSHYQEAVKIVESGELGKIRTVRVWACLAWVGSIGRPADSDPPPGVDYDLWLGPAPLRPFNPTRFHFNFRWFWDYAGGLMTDWGVHLINIVQWAMHVKHPVSVASTGGKYAIDDIQETPDTQAAIFEYPGFVMIWDHQVAGTHGVRRREHGVAFDGESGTLVVDGAGWEIIPAPGKSLEARKAAGVAGPRWEHVRNFLDCCRSRERPASDVEIGHFATLTPHLANIALHTGRTIHWDGEKQEISGDADASRLITKPYRAPWKLDA
ncbi:MAG: Gfo/Idh/MocA family oxidoreductase [Planctomycetes bacterium]|nr:Gfo/Idh/MocA family oxidoreductase [Planctomycetota bacterium]